jgi:peptidoglycan hydrolase-like protein with peptidoglycan-binding domain
MWWRLAAAAGAAVVVLAPGSTGVSLAAPAAIARQTSYLAMMNAERASYGVAPLTRRRDLTTVATAWARHMAFTGQLAHNPRLASAVANWRSVGENVGEGPTISGLAAAFWASAEHRTNILDRGYRDVGIGRVRAAGTIWIAVVFRDPLRAQQPVAGRVVSAAIGHPSVRLTRLLFRGTVGRDVVRLQRMLSVAADGMFGPITQRAVVRFQRRHRLAVDGVVGPQTWAALLR